ncbi:excisionase family DNA binding protein [Lacinutrix venerupis]|uniref:helix-turn-helix transcriptional regulator n=1 Tax=Lacinutrix venerupis TaxID=1486034 RepID=UPI000EAFB952|nr:helix-turn-helix domain-containing protein [Lacinutrix venerupis]RLJ60777.1 excisionase family DNA binding protein [Lacinutrix venerupis]
MSSNIRIEKVCQFCNSVFTAKTTKTKYCDHRCSNKAYKRKKREEKIGLVKQEQISNNSHMFKMDIQKKDILSVSEASILIGCSKKTIYRLIKEKRLNAFNFSKRLTRISRSEINKFLELPILENNIPNMFLSSEYITISELQKWYKDRFSKSSIYEILKSKEVTKITKGRMVYVLKEEAHNALK